VDTTRHAVEVIVDFKQDYYFIHITDTHLPTHRYHYQTGADTDSSEMVDLRKVIADINIINPEFVLITGDLVNEGELEDYLNRRYYSKAQRMLTEFEVPTYLTAGNHDIGGWSSTPPSDGTARRDWWRFFGWKRLDSPPPGAPWYTQNYSFDYGPVHYVALEAYDNYDYWRYGIYGSDSFTSGQMQWLSQDLAAASGSAAQVLFYHYDFSRQINLNALGVEMALWGHIHRDAGSLAGPPYNLATDNVCDGARSYRLVRVSDGTLHPSPTISAGNAGRNLEVDFEPANNGTVDSVTAYITNNLAERFEHAMLQFNMPLECDSVTVTGGTLLAVETLDAAARYYVGVDILPSSSAAVTVRVDSGPAGDDTTGVQALRLAPNSPNPFNPQTVLSFTLPAAGRARIAIYDIRGREVTVLADRDFIAGPHSEEWDGKDSNSVPVSSGIYFARLTFGGQDLVQKMVLAR
jgi:3',5'-cyclic AMP phosphodiesterase CpdA